jgi:hypothetical protein
MTTPPQGTSTPPQPIPNMTWADKDIAIYATRQLDKIVAKTASTSLWLGIMLFIQLVLVALLIAGMVEAGSI